MSTRNAVSFCGSTPGLQIHSVGQTQLRNSHTDTLLSFHLILSILEHKTSKFFIKDENEKKVPWAICNEYLTLDEVNATEKHKNILSSMLCIRFQYRLVKDRRIMDTRK